MRRGNSHLEARREGWQVFRMAKPRWVGAWTKQPYPVMLVIGTFAEDTDQPRQGKDRLEFAAVRWKEITSVLERKKAKGVVKRNDFTGSRMEALSVRLQTEGPVFRGGGNGPSDVSDCKQGLGPRAKIEKHVVLVGSAS